MALRHVNLWCVKEHAAELRHGRYFSNIIMGLSAPGMCGGSTQVCNRTALGLHAARLLGLPWSWLIRGMLQMAISIPVKYECAGKGMTS